MKKILLIIVLACLVIASVSASSATGTFGNIDVTDYTGKRVTGDFFKDYDVTVINVFTTWCTWCVKELPDIVKLAKEMPEGTKIIAVCADAYDAPDDLKAILEAYKVDFPVLKMTEKQVKEIGTIIGYPTTFYVNREGTILDITIGMPAGGVSGYKTKAVQLLEKYRTSK